MRISSLFQLSVRGKNAKEQLSGFFKAITKTADEVFLAKQKVNIEKFIFYLKK